MIQTAARPKNFVPIRKTGDETFNRAQDAIAQSMKSIIDVPFLDGVLLEEVELTGSAVNLVAHGLGRAHRGWWICDQTEPSEITRDATTDESEANYLALTVSDTTIVTLWVF